MNAPVDSDNVHVSDLSRETLRSSVALDRPLAEAASAGRETAPAADDKICWIEMRQAPYPPDQQVELLHLQAEAEALLLQLQAMHQRRQHLTKTAVGNP